VTEVSDATGNVKNNKLKEDVPWTGSPPVQSGSNDAVESYRKRHNDRMRTIFRRLGEGVALGAGKEVGEQIIHDHGQDMVDGGNELIDRGLDLVDWFLSLLGN
jgi:hypothetical protein